MTKNCFRIGLLGIFILSLSLRFWGLDRFNTLVFDEVYYAKFGNNYLTHTPFFNAHPPLSQYLIGIGIWLGTHVHLWQTPVNGLAGSVLSPWNYRWLNALTGSFVPLVVALIAYGLSYQRSFALLAGFFTACDGLLLVESRYALSDIYIVIFGLLGQWFLLLALENKNYRRWLWLGLAGTAFGASAGTKWNGLWFLLGAYWMWIVAWVIRWWQPRTTANSTTPLTKLTQINIFQMLFALGLLPAVVYRLIWIPHLQLDKRFGFIAVHQQILGFHLRMGGNIPSVHPYCAAWYKWPLMTRTMSYFYQTTHSFDDPLPGYGPDLPSAAGKVIYDVHAMGNPFLWWFGLAAIALLGGQILVSLVRKNVDFNTWIALYIVLNYAANFLPWVAVTRCTFIYHYICALPFLFLAIAWVVDQCLRSYLLWLRILGVTITFTIIAAFIFWMPIYLGLPLSDNGFKIRMWFSSWI